MKTNLDLLEEAFEDCFDAATRPTEGGYGPDTTDKNTLLRSLRVHVKHFAIAFAEWLNKEGYVQYDSPDRWISPTHNNDVLTTEQLFDQFKSVQP